MKKVMRSIGQQLLGPSYLWIVASIGFLAWNISKSDIVGTVIWSVFLVYEVWAVAMARRVIQKVSAYTAALGDEQIVTLSKGYEPVETPYEGVDIPTQWSEHVKDCAICRGVADK